MGSWFKIYDANFINKINTKIVYSIYRIHLYTLHKHTWFNGSLNVLLRNN